jgi:cytochrome c-type biogenesis protein CcmF
VSSQIGYYSLILGLFFSFFIIPILIRNFNNTKIIDKRIFFVLFFQLFFVIISFGGLIFSFINSDFSNETVFNNSHTTKPLFYKISGTWGNHEGSLLLWLLVLTLFIFLFLIKSNNQPKKYRILTILFQQIIIIGFFLFVLKTSNPFNYLIPAPKEGLGLNPILQDPALAIHPPILYLGYVGSSIIFSSSLSAVILNYISQSWAKHIKVWILITWIFLTIGILLGSIWAYYELGWGGFWFWDPVENVSLMPWLCLTALLHCILVLEKKLLLTSWVIVLSISTFVLSMSGTFLVRSGILNSVHTFANDPERGVFILVFLFSLIFLSLMVFFLFHKQTKKFPNKVNLFSKETAIIFNNWFLMYFLSVVLIGTLYPIFLDVLTSEKISVGPPFYQKLIVPFLIPFLVFMSVGPNLKWIKSNLKMVNFSLILLFVMSLIISFIILKKNSSSTLISTILFSVSFYLFFITIKDFFNKSFKTYSQKIAHFGFSLLILTILLNSFFSTEIITNLKVGKKYFFTDGNLHFKKIETSQIKNYKSIIGHFTIQDKKNIIEMKPELRIYSQPNIITSEADIKITLFSDKFLVINLVKDSEFFNVRFQSKPFMVWIWISVALLAIGGIFSLAQRFNEK